MEDSMSDTSDKKAGIPTENTNTAPATTTNAVKGEKRATPARTTPVKEIGGREGPEPTRYGDWEKNGIISDF